MRLIDSTRLSESAEPKFFVSGILKLSRNLLDRSKLARVYPRDIVHEFIRKAMGKLRIQWLTSCRAGAQRAAPLLTGYMADARGGYRLQSPSVAGRQWYPE